jgi:hypothetical protein
VLGQQPSEAPSVLGDHLHPAKAEHQIVFFFLLPLCHIVSSICNAWLSEYVKRKHNICAKA